MGNVGEAKMGTEVISTSGLHRRFGPTLAVEDLNLRVSAGQVTAFLGPNGAGKTTTIRLLLGLLRPDAGEVWLFGQALSNQREKLLGRVGALVETPVLYPHLSGHENLELTRRLLGVPRSRTDQVLAVVDLVQAARRPVRGYSLGMRQRLGLALAMLGEPELLILDEPTNGLDPAGIHQMRELICRLPAELGATVFLSSHLLSEVEQMATEVAVLGGGLLLFQGSLDQLQTQRSACLAVGLDRPREAAAWLTARGWGVQEGKDGLLRVEAQGQEAATRLCADLVGAGFGVHHLAKEASSLEAAFLDLTATDRPQEVP